MESLLARDLFWVKKIFVIREIKHEKENVSEDVFRCAHRSHIILDERLQAD
jgi:hypothetical protein